MEVRKITEEHELHAYQELCRYCFPNLHNWIDNLLPLPQDDLVLGVFLDKMLQSGVIAKSLAAYLFKQKVNMSGIGAVASAPERRNSGHVRELMKQTLQHEFERGMLVSSLYPFLFQFYEKTGYGDIGGPRLYTMKPEDLRPFKIAGEFIPVTSAEQAEMFIQAHNRFVRNYNFGTEFQHISEKYAEMLKSAELYAYMYQCQHDIRGYLEYHLQTVEPFSKKMHIGRFGFLDAEAFQALLGFIRSHRKQCCEVTLLVPENVDLRHVFEEPRVKAELFSNWMARPLDVEAVLRLRLAHDPCKTEISFSITDPVLEKNTGTFSLQGTDVVKTAHTNHHALPFSLLSSLLFSAFTFDQAYYAGKLDWYDAAMAAYFSKKGDIYLSAFF